ncbi:9845_t:CDS:2, partial [Paraglomus brasilianum]
DIDKDVRSPDQKSYATILKNEFKWLWTPSPLQPALSRLDIVTVATHRTPSSQWLRTPSPLQSDGGLLRIGKKTAVKIRKAQNNKSLRVVTTHLSETTPFSVANRMLKGDGESQEAQANAVASSSSVALPSLSPIPKGEMQGNTKNGKMAKMVGDMIVEDLATATNACVTLMKKLAMFLEWKGNRQWWKKYYYFELITSPNCRSRTVLEGKPPQVGVSDSGCSMSTTNESPVSPPLSSLALAFSPALDRLRCLKAAQKLYDNAPVAVKQGSIRSGPS